MLWIVPAIALLAQEHKRIVDLRLDGLQSQACYVAVEKALLASAPVERVVYWCEKKSYRTHIVLKDDATLTLADLEAALAAARKEMKDTLQMTVAYRLDEADLRLPAGTKFTADGREQSLDKETTLAELRKAVALSSLALPEKCHPKPAYVCPNGCSASDGEAICPKCGSALAKVEAPKESGG